jgi:hypothetical protein
MAAHRETAVEVDEDVAGFGTLAGTEDTIDSRKMGGISNP